MLGKTQRASYLKELGFCKQQENIDGAIINFKKKYSNRFNNNKTEQYTLFTDNMLVNAYKVHKYTKNFKIEEFFCKCNSKYCHGMSTIIDTELLMILQKLRDHFNKSIIITSGIRCPSYNASLSGSIVKTTHCVGKAVDIYIEGLTDTISGRKKIYDYFMKQPKSAFSYYYDKTSNNILFKKASWMGEAVHIQVK